MQRFGLLLRVYFLNNFSSYSQGPICIVLEGGDMSRTGGLHVNLI